MLNFKNISTHAQQLKVRAGKHNSKGLKSLNDRQIETVITE